MGYLFKYDAFVSYSRDDEKWVERLVTDLKGNGLDVFLDTCDLIPGLDSLRQLTRAVKKSRAGIIILSPSSVTSWYVSVETGVMLSKAAEDEMPLIPVLYKDCVVPDWIKKYQWVDFRGESEEAYQKKLGKLSDALGREVGHRSRQKGQTLKGILFLVLLLTLAPIAVAGAITHWTRVSLASRLRETQESIQRMDVRIQTLSGLSGASVARAKGEFMYHDPQTGEHLATDIWEKGRLVYRRFYQGDHVIAVDKFLYDGNTISGKVRECVDAQRRVFLVDMYTQTGILTLKRFMPDGDENRSVNLVDDLRSPLPPTPVIFYR